MRFVFLLLANVVWLMSSASSVQAQFGGVFSFAATVPEVETDELKSLLDRRSDRVVQSSKEPRAADAVDFVLVDVRSDAEIAVSRIPGSITKADFERDPERYQEKLVIPYCWSGGRSRAFAMRWLEKDARVKNYAGSMSAWIKSNGALVDPDGEATRRVYVPSRRVEVPKGYEPVHADQ